MYVKTAEHKGVLLLSGNNNHYHNHFYIYGSWVLSLAKLVGWGGKDGGSACLLCWWHS